MELSKILNVQDGKEKEEIFFAKQGDLKSTNKADT